ncbi:MULTISPECIES: DUF1330 domain-containing protein [Mycobacteriaceae]|uniref:DUF1330 domain-containing protein n=1 Tax=Mycobacteriaceae TaxID=1762 RepID=UPI0009A73C89|nr:MULTISPECIES: DUF1330 domain-containing protein [Mycobacteriaceae]QZH61219.1 DUF1330 domain-containing protein [Mycolicibacterium farcinogenes]SKQ86929.1 Uncharacterized conserved protein [Mycobacteroides abscessus subsp. massiliense]
MTALVIARIRVTDTEKYEAYKPLSKMAIEQFGGRYLVRGAEPITLEGESEDVRLVIVEFDSVEAAVGFYDSAEYRRAREARNGAADTVIEVLQGV